MKKYFFTFIISYFLIGICLLVAQIPVDQIEGSAHLAKKAMVYEDPHHKLNIKDILNDFAISEYQRFVKSDVPYMDFTTSSYWMKLMTQNQSQQTQDFYIELVRPLTNELRFYLFDENQQLIDSIVTGDDYLFADRPFNNRKFLIPISYPPNSERIILIRASSDGEILKLPLKFWRIDEFNEFTSKESFFLGLYYGLFILVILLFSFFGIALRQKLYLFFVSYVFFLGLFQFSLDGLAYQYLWPTSPWLGNHAILILAAASMLCMLWYVRKFLEFSNEHKGYLKVYNLFTILVLISLLASFGWGAIYAQTFPILNALSFIIIFYILYGIYLKYREGDKPELPVTIAFIILCLSAILFIASNVSMIDSEFLAANALKVGSAAEVTFLSIAMALRYRRVQDEKVEAQDVAFKRLEEINELKSEQTEKLEKEVELRTQEIVEKNEILSNKNEEIINSITYAKRLQDAILPSNQILANNFQKYSIFFQPKDIVSGDFYWLEATESKVYFAVADCTGHGVPGAMVSVVGYNALNKCINELGLTEAGEILDQLTVLVEETFSKSLDSVSDGMDICLCSWDYKNEVKYAGAFNPLYIIRGDEVSELAANRQPIGKFDNRQAFETQQIHVKEGDEIVLFSDGFPDQFGGAKGKKLKYSNFKKILLRGVGLYEDEFFQFLLDEFTNWRGKEEQIDDVCVLKIGF